MGISHPPSRLGSGKAVSIEVGGSTECTGHISKWLSSSPPARNRKGFFSDLHCEKMVELLEVKHKSGGWGNLRLGPQEFLTSR